MIHRTITLNVPEQSVELTVYAPENYPEIDLKRTRPAVIVCPGGAYWMRSDREAEPVALHLAAADVCVFVLHYAVRPARYPVALQQLAAAVDHVRTHWEEYHVDPDRIAVMGFSAGGHLAASLGVRWHMPWLSQKLGKTPEDIRPNGMVLCYPVITGGPWTHAGSMENLLGTTDRAQWLSQSLEELVTDQTPKAFVWHTYEDEAVPLENSLQFFTAMRRCGVPGELHVYPSGVHGLSLGTEQSCNPVLQPEYIQREIGNWISMTARWLHQM